MRKFTSLLLLGCFISFGLHAQVNKCATKEHEAVLRAKYPDYDARRQEIENFTQKFIEKQKAIPGAKMSGAVITIPVVFHVVYKTAAQNIPDERLFEQIDILNEDFRRLNADADDTPDDFLDEAADCEIEFCLAQIDPDGAPTTGILRVPTTVSSFGVDDDVKFDASGGSDAWPRDSYLNFWVCNLGAFLLGYAQFPGGPAATDGVVIHFEHVGYNDDGYPYHLGRTATHEVGHWLNLYHIWGDDTGCGGSDLVGDTPNQKVETYGCPSFPKTDMCSGDPPGIMFMNYMDYSDDACMNMFTSGQKARMQAIFEPGGDRYEILSASVCALEAFDVQAIDAIPNGVTCNTTISPVVTIRNGGSETLTSVDIEYSIDGGSTTIFPWTGSLATGDEEEVILPDLITAEGSHTISVTLSNPNGNPDGDVSDNTIETDFEVTLTGGPLPMVEGFESTGWPYAGYVLDNPDEYYTWERTNDGASLGTWSVFMDHFDNDAIGSVDEFTLPGYDFTGYPDAYLTFDVAYALYTASGAYSDTLIVYISDDCGDSWNEIYRKANPDLQTADHTTSYFEPADDEWRKETIDVSDYIGASQVFVKFTTISDYENNLYVDNINISEEQVSVQNISNFYDLHVYPNPTSDWINVAALFSAAGTLQVAIYDVLGNIVYLDAITAGGGTNNFSIPLTGLASGNYRIEITSDGMSANAPFVKL